MSDQSSEAVLLTAAQLAAKLNISQRTLWRLRSAGKVPQPLRLGGIVRWHVDDVEAWLAARGQASR
jgi:excisionase family DNA binding protein